MITIVRADVSVVNPVIWYIVSAVSVSPIRISQRASNIRSSRPISSMPNSVPRPREASTQPVVSIG